MKYIEPKSLLTLFTCPHCGVLAHQHHLEHMTANDNTYNTPVRVSKCEYCDELCVWYFEALLYPIRAQIPNPNKDMPDSIKKDYKEAASVYKFSPRSSAALLRLAIQKLCCELGAKGDNINADIKQLVKNGLPEIVQQSLDMVRVIGSKAVKPGQIDSDNPFVAGSLFTLINVITDHMISAKLHY